MPVLPICGVLDWAPVEQEVAKLHVAHRLVCLLERIRVVSDPMVGINAPGKAEATGHPAGLVPVVLAGIQHGFC